MSQATIRVMIVDDHEILRAGVCELLRKESDVSVVAEASNGRQALEVARLHSPDVVVMDLRMPDMSGIDAARAIIDEQPSVKVVALSSSTDAPIIRQTLLAGASAFITKSSAFEELVAAIRAVMGGENYFSASVAQEMAASQANGGEAMPLTPREREVLQLLAGGRTTKAAAVSLSLSAKTIETHRRNLMRKLDVDNLADLTKFAIRTGLTSTEG